MKTLQKYFPFLLIILTFSCSQSSEEEVEDNVNLNNHLLIDGKRYELDKGYIDLYSDIDQGEVYYGAYIFLTSSGINYNQNDEFEGKGNFFRLEVTLPSDDDLASGTYSVLDESNSSYTPFDITNMVVLVDLDTDVEEEDPVDLGPSDQIDLVTVKISKEGNHYVFEINTPNVTGHYKGELTPIVW